jgi:hypothetical protein
MSWTIETPGEKVPEVLRKAITTAKESGIVMFCSASDQGGSSSNQCWPGGIPNTCIRIGSCSSSDVPSAWVRDDQVDFLLPGENILVTDKDGTAQPQEGSSFATAIAAGLGGLLVYLCLMLKADSAQNQPQQTSGEDATRSGDDTWDFQWDYDTMLEVLRKSSVQAPPLTDRKLVKPEHFIVQEYRTKLKKLLPQEKAAKAKLPLDQQTHSSQSLEALGEVMKALLKVSAPTRKLSYGTCSSPQFCCTIA